MHKAIAAGALIGIIVIYAIVFMHPPSIKLPSLTTIPTYTNPVAFNPFSQFTYCESVGVPGHSCGVVASANSVGPGHACLTFSDTTFICQPATYAQKFNDPLTLLDYLFLMPGNTPVDCVAGYGTPSNCSGNGSPPVPTGSYSVAGTLSQPTFLGNTTADALCNISTTDCNAGANPKILTYNTASGVYAFYIYRYWFNLGLSTQPSLRSTVNCTSPVGCLGTVDVSTQVKQQIAAINNMDTWNPGTAISIRLTTPTSAYNNATNWSTIAGAWTSGTGFPFQPAGCTQSNPSSTCAIAENGAHVNLALFKDPSQTTGVASLFSTFPASLNQYTATQLNNIGSANAVNTAYISIHPQKYGSIYGFKPNGNGLLGPTCTVGGSADVNSCLVVPPQTTENLWIVFDVVSNGLYVCTTCTPGQGGGSIGTLTGRVTDASFAGLVPVAGATVAVDNGVWDTVTGSDGSFKLTVGFGSHTVIISGPSYYPTPPITVQVNLQQTYSMGTVGLNPLNPWYNFSFCIWIICIPYWVIVMGFLFLIAVVVFLRKIP